MKTGAPTRLLPWSHAHRSFEGRSSRFYDVLARRLLRRVYRRIADDIATVAPAGGAVLDVGTGPGILLSELAARRPDLHVTGVDLSADMVAIAERNIGQYADRASARVADVTDLPFDACTFDVIATSFSLHHWEDIPQAVPELARVLRPAGRLCVYDFKRAPFDVLDATARANGSFAEEAEHTVIRTGHLHIWRIARHILSAGDHEGGR